MMTDTMNAQATVATNGASRGEVILSAPRDAAVSTPPASVPVGAVEYRPKPGSLADRVLRFFAENPDEELTTLDIVAKFDAPPRSVRMLLLASINAEYLILGHVPPPRGRGSPMLIYKPGPRLARRPERVTELIEWIPASTIPPHHGHVLIVTPHGVEMGYHSGCWRDADGIDADVTHWAELPEGPQA